MAHKKDIFASKSAGKTAVALKDPNRKGTGCDIKVGGTSLNDSLYLLSVSGGGEVNLQLDVNFDNALFVTVFGEKITALAFRGLAVPGLCDDGKGGSSIVSFYNKYKAGAGKQIQVITVAYNKGDFVFKGILTKMALQPYTQAGPDAFTFDMTLQGRVASKNA